MINNRFQLKKIWKMSEQKKISFVVRNGKSSWSQSNANESSSKVEHEDGARPRVPSVLLSLTLNHLECFLMKNIKIVSSLISSSTTRRRWWLRFLSALHVPSPSCPLFFLCKEMKTNGDVETVSDLIENLRGKIACGVEKTERRKST